MRRVLFLTVRYAIVALVGAVILPAEGTKDPKLSTGDHAVNESADLGEAHHLEKIQVTGSRIKTVELEGPSPVKVITRSDIESSGRTNLTDLLRDLPEVGAIGINEGATVGFVRGATAINLRSFGANNTLVIVNGRRTVTTAAVSAISGGTTFVDVNRFPIAMVERIEVLKDGASAVYGADATAGVVNIILRKNFSGTEAGFAYGNSTKTDVGEQSFSLVSGTTGKKSNLTLGFSHLSRAALVASDTTFARNADLSERYLAKSPIYADRVAAGAFDLRAGGGPQARINLTGAAAGQVNGTNGVNIPGLPIGTVINRLPGTGGVVPTGTGVLLGTLASATPSFSAPSTAATGGTFSAAAANTYVAEILTPRSNPSNLYNYIESYWLTPEVNRTGAHAIFRYDLARDVELYAEAFYQRNKTHIEFAASPMSTAGDNNVVVPKTNYYNPFGVDLAFTYRPVDLGLRKADVTNTSYSLLLGARGTFRSRFDWDLAYSHGHDEMTDLIANCISESRLRQQLALNTPAAFNILGGAGYRNPQATLDAVRTSFARTGSSTLELWDAEITGDLFELATGMVSSAVYGEVRREKFNTLNDDASSTLNDIVGYVKMAEPTISHRTVASAAAELRVPLVKPASISVAYKLDLHLAARFEDFSDGYDSRIKPHVGLRYQPGKALVLRGSYSQTFRAPTLPQLFGGETQSLPNGLPDLRRPAQLTGDPFDGAATQRLVRQGGNTTLMPETADVYQYGFVWDLPFQVVKGLSVGASLYHIDQKDVIAASSTTYIRNNEVGGGTDLLVIRDPGTESYTNNTSASINVLSGPNGATTPVAPGQTVQVPGRIRSILNSVSNLAKQKVEGCDFEVAYRKKTAGYGHFSSRNTVSYLAYYGYASAPATALANQAGTDTFPRVRLQSSLDWDFRAYAAGVQFNYTSGYGDLVRNGFEVDSYQTLGGYVAWTANASLGQWLKNFRFTFGVDNLLDRDPPLYYLATGYDQRMVGRPAGRYWYTAVKKTF